MSALELGAGRKTKEDKIDPAAGIIFNPKIGDKIKKGEEIAKIFTNKKEKIDEVKKMISDSLTISSKKVKPVKAYKKSNKIN